MLFGVAGGGRRGITDVRSDDRAVTQPEEMPELDRRMAVLSPHLYDGVPLTVAARRQGVPVRTAQRWLASYRVEGAAGLTRSPRADRGMSFLDLGGAGYSC